MKLTIVFIYNGDETSVVTEVNDNSTKQNIEAAVKLQFETKWSADDYRMSWLMDRKEEFSILSKEQRHKNAQKGITDYPKRFEMTVKCLVKEIALEETDEIPQSNKNVTPTTSVESLIETDYKELEGFIPLTQVSSEGQNKSSIEKGMFHSASAHSTFARKNKKEESDEANEQTPHPFKK